MHACIDLNRIIFNFSFYAKETIQALLITALRVLAKTFQALKNLVNDSQSDPGGLPEVQRRPGGSVVNSNLHKF